MGLLELSKERQVFFIVPQESGSGVRRIAEKVSADVTHTSGAHPVFCSSIRQAAAVQDEAVKMADNAGRTGDVSGMQAVVAVTDGGELAAQLAARSPGLKAVSGKRESYAFFLLDYPLGAEEGQREAAQDCGTGSPAAIETALVIYGSDKLGTIYGLFHLSELLGVTPYVYWGDADPVSYERITLAAEPGTECTGGREKQVQVENFCSKEPSVKYRGFFINDEWPCFGNWTFSHFGGFTAQMYDHVFEYLLRLKRQLPLAGHVDIVVSVRRAGACVHGAGGRVWHLYRHVAP